MNTKNEMIKIPIEQLYPHPDNPRKNIGDVTELADSIKAKGILQNLTVVERKEGGYTIIIGHRRHAAATLAGIEALPCVVADMSYAEQIQTMALENMQRSNLTAYEQAQCFQLMLDLGGSVEKIAKETGFSESTVRRRLEWCKLNPELFDKVSRDRQITIGDIDKLSAIDDQRLREECLGVIGTENFKLKYERSLRIQNIKSAIPKVMETIKAITATEIESSERYTGKYESILSINITKEKINLSEINKHKDEKIFYFLSKEWGELTFYIRTKKNKVPPKSQKEIDREKYIEDTRKALDELNELSYKLRSDFVNNLIYTSKNQANMLAGAIDAIICMACEYGTPSKNDICKHLGFEYDYGHSEESKKQIYIKAFEQRYRAFPKIIYDGFCDSIYLKCHSDYKKEFPKYKKNERLEALYRWLTSLGYDMSKDEQTLLNGANGLYEDKDLRS